MNQAGKWTERLYWLYTLDTFLSLAGRFIFIRLSGGTSNSITPTMALNYGQQSLTAIKSLWIDSAICGGGASVVARVTAHLFAAQRGPKQNKTKQQKKTPIKYGWQTTNLIWGFCSVCPSTHLSPPPHAAMHKRTLSNYVAAKFRQKNKQRRQQRTRRTRRALAPLTPASPDSRRNTETWRKVAWREREKKNSCL